MNWTAKQIASAEAERDRLTTREVERAIASQGPAPVTREDFVQSTTDTDNDRPF